MTLIVFAMALLPVASWAVGRSALALSDQATGNLAILAWLLTTFAVLAIGGGALSPLVVIVLLGPFSAMAQGRNIVAIEVLVLGVLAWGVSISAGAAGWSDTVPESWSSLIAPLTMATVVQLGVMFWACGPVMTPRQTAANDSATPQEGAARRQDVTELSLPLLLIRASEEGRIRDIFGPENLRWPELGIGRELGFLNDVKPNEIASVPGGATFNVIGAPIAEGGRWIGLLPHGMALASLEAGNDQSAQDRATAAEAELVERTVFFAGLGHDLKTPLNAIIGFSELMKEEVRGPLPDAYKDYPGIIHESGQDLMLLVEDMLDLAKSEAKGHRLELEPVDLAASGSSVARQLQDMASRAEVTLKFPGGEPIWAEADARAVRQIWQNLVSNAIKYSNPGGQVTLSATKLSGAVAISVSDQGAGMDQADLDRIAKPFAQGLNSKGRAGTGLGLAVVHRFAQLHGGKVIIDTQQNKGTRVRVTLPALDAGLMEMTKDAAS
ncbi:MAG: HAMP domain-containing sensor histidine kinase [Hyphomonadaceae bacterium]